MKQKNRTAFIFRIFAVGICLTLLLVGLIVAMQSAGASPPGLETAAGNCGDLRGACERPVVVAWID